MHALAAGRRGAEYPERLLRHVEAGVAERWITVDGLETHYLTAGEGPPLVLLHGDGESALDWSWVLPTLARRHRVYAPDLPGAGQSAKPRADYSPAFFARSVAAWLDALGIERAAVAGNSLGGLVALCLALSDPSRVTALGLVGSAGLGRAISPVMISLTFPLYGDLAIGWAGTPLGAPQRAWGRAALLFASPGRAPRAWLADQQRLALTPGFLGATLAALRATAGPGGQRLVLLDQLPRLRMPTLVVWGTDDRIFPADQARAAVERLPRGELVLIPDCGHLPHVECPDRFADALGRFLADHTPSPPP